MKIAMITTLSAAVLSLVGCDAFNKSYNENFDKSFRENCVSEATKRGAPEGLSTQACNCTIEKLQANNTDGGPLLPSQDEQMAAVKECMAEMQ